jgi:hypothetical protein
VSRTATMMKERQLSPIGLNKRKSFMDLTSDLWWILWYSFWSYPTINQTKIGLFFVILGMRNDRHPSIPRFSLSRETLLLIP